MCPHLPTTHYSKQPLSFINVNYIVETILAGMTNWSTSPLAPGYQIYQPKSELSGANQYKFCVIRERAFPIRRVTRHAGNVHGQTKLFVG